MTESSHSFLGRGKASLPRLEKRGTFGAQNSDGCADLEEGVPSLLSTYIDSLSDELK
jgi:hypothetical protein